MFIKDQNNLGSYENQINNSQSFNRKKSIDDNYKPDNLSEIHVDVNEDIKNDDSMIRNSDSQNNDQENM